MADPTDVVGDVSEALVSGGAHRRSSGSQRGGKELTRARRVEALSMRMAGISLENIANHLDVSEARVRVLIENLLAEAENRSAGEMRAIENARLDRAQAAIWSEVIRGDLKAINTFLRISDQRARMNGLNAPTQVDLSVNVRQEMEAALSELETMLEGEVIEDAEVEDGDEPADGTG